MKPGIYIGIKPTNEIPQNCAYKELSHTENNAGRTVNYYHVWVKEGEIQPLFPDDGLMSKDTLYNLDKIFNNTKKIRYK